MKGYSSFRIGCSYPYSRLQNSQFLFSCLQNSFSPQVWKFHHFWFLTLFSPARLQYPWIAMLNCQSNVSNRAFLTCLQIMWPFFLSRSGGCTYAARSLHLWVYSLMLSLSFFSRLDKVVLSGEMSMLYLYCLMKASTRFSNYGSWCCLVSCTNSMVPHSNYLGKNASVIFLILNYFFHFLILWF